MRKSRGKATNDYPTNELFIEHFARRLLRTHSPDATFTCPAYPSTDTLCESVCDVIGRNGGVFPNALTHGCKDHTHRKRYREDLINEGVVLEDGNAADVADIPGGAELLL